MNRSVYIHAGAHRTGTSSFQQCLFRNRAVLAEHGLDAAYPGRDGAPKGKLNLRLPRPWHGDNWPENTVERLRGHLARMNPNKDRGLVFSEENIPGPMRHFFEGRFFPGARQRLRALAQALETPPTHVLYVVRSYDALFLSAYRKRAEDNPVLDFDGLVPTLADMDRGWPGLISDIRDELRPERLTVMEYGARGSSRDLLARLVPGLEGAELAEPARLVNLSATDAGLLALQARYRAGEQLARPEWKAVLQDHAADTELRGFAAFPDDVAEKLRDRYARDLERLASMPGITFG